MALACFEMDFCWGVSFWGEVISGVRYFGFGVGVGWGLLFRVGLCVWGRRVTLVGG